MLSERFSRRAPLLSRPSEAPNCGLRSLSALLTGQPRREPLFVVDLPSGMGGGPELDFLELRMLELQGIADLSVVAESGYSFRGDQKPRLFRSNSRHFEEMKASESIGDFHYLDMERCEKYVKQIMETRRKHPSEQALWGIQNTQRHCLWQLLDEDRPDLPENAMVIFSDLDEIPSREVMMAMKHCEWKRPEDRFRLKQRTVSYNLRQVSEGSPKGCFPKTPWIQGAFIRLGWARAQLKKDEFIPLRMGNDVSMLEGGAIHLSYFGSAASLMLKGLQHGEGGGLMLPGSMSLCNRSSRDASEILRVFRDDPVRYVRSWEHKSHPLPPKVSMEDLKSCAVPSALVENPKRYADFWGLDSEP